MEAPARRARRRCPGPRGGRRHDGDRLPPRRGGRELRRHSEDHRRRSRGDGAHLRPRHGRGYGDARGRRAALDRRVPPAGHGRRGHGTQRRMDCASRGHRRRGRRDPRRRSPTTRRGSSAKIRERDALGLRFSIAVIGEGAHSAGAGASEVEPARQGRPARLGGAGERLAQELAEAGVTHEVRVTVLGHLQRGGGPTASDRVLATRFGAHAAELCAEGRFGRMVALRNGVVESLPLDEACAARGTVDRPVNSCAARVRSASRWARRSAGPSRLESGRPDRRGLRRAAHTSSGTIRMAPHGHSAAQRPQPLQKSRSMRKRFPGPSLMTALSGQTP